jgi:uncharacterized protein (TIGR00106 family)
LANNIVTAEIQIAVLGEHNDSLSGYISSAVKALEKMNIQYQVTPMGTAIQADSVDKILEACKTAHQAVLDMGVNRILTNITIDHRIKGSKEMNDKVQSVLSKL